MRTLGYLIDHHDSRDLIYGERMYSVMTPSEVDYRPEMPPIRNQHKQGACVSFALCAIKEWQEGYQRGFKEKFDFSEQFLYSHTQVFPGGSFPREALTVLMDIGVPLESQMPYSKAKEVKLEKPKKSLKTINLYGTARRYRSKGYIRLKTVADVMQSLSINGPAFTGMEWLEGWNDLGGATEYHSTLKDKMGSVIGGHAVTIVGFQRRERRFIIRNQWSTSWGFEGYGYLPFAVFEKYAKDTWAIFDLDSPLVKE